MKLREIFIICAFVIKMSAFAQINSPSALKENSLKSGFLAASIASNSTSNLVLNSTPDFRLISKENALLSLKINLQNLKVAELSNSQNKANLNPTNSPELDISSFKNPFFETLTPSFKIQALLNDRVKINSKWYQEGDFISQAQILDIKDDEILLKQDSKLIKLKATRSNHKIFID